MSEERPPLRLDIRPDQWSFAKKLAFRKAVADAAALIGEEPVGVNASYARLHIERAANAAIIGQAQGRADAHDEMFNLDLKWLVAFAWMAEREHDAEVTIGQIIERTDEGELIEALYEAILAEIEDDAKDAAPLDAANSAPTRPTSRRSAKGSKSSSSSPTASGSATSPT